MPNKNKKKLTEEQIDVIAEQMARFFYEFWQTHDLITNKKGEKVVTLKSGFSSEDFSGNKVTS